MSIFTRKYSKFMMLSGLVLISALSAEQAYSTTVTTLLNANHRITWHNGNKVNGIFYIRAEAPLITIMNVDYKGIANVRRGYTLDAAITYFFRTGERSISSYSWVGNLRRGFGTVPERSANIRLDFRKACGLKGGIASFVKLRNKSTGAYLRIVQGPRDIPFAGGIVPVAIDCRVPTISKINGSAPDRLNNMCVDTHGSYGLSIGMVDDIGIGNVEISSNNPALRISPSRIGSAQIRKASGKNLFTADFSMRANNAGPINRVGITARVSDMAGHHKEYHFSVNLAGNASNAFRVNLTPLRSVTVGQRTAFGGTLLKQSCAANIGRFMWQIIKVPSRTSTRAQSIVARTGSGRWLLKPTNRRGTPFIAPFTPAHGGFYRLQLLDAHHTTFYTSPALEVMDAVRRGVSPPKPSRPARRQSAPDIKRLF